MSNKIWLGTSDTTFSTAANWSGSVAPTTGDDVYIVPEATNNIAGESFTLALNSFSVMPNSSKTGGSSGTDLAITFAGQSDRYLSFSCTSQWFLDAVSAANVSVERAGVASGGFYGLNLTGSACTAFDMDAGSNDTVGIAARAGESAGYDTIRVTGGTLYLGFDESSVTDSAGTGDPDLSVGGGTVVSRCDLDATAISAGEVTTESGAIATLTGTGTATLYHNSSGTITTANLYDSFTLDLSGSRQPVTITTLSVYSDNVTIKDPFGRLTLTNGIKCYAKPTSVLSKFDTPARQTITFSALA